jgi:hypothetical protein
MPTQESYAGSRPLRRSRNFHGVVQGAWHCCGSTPLYFRWVICSMQGTLSRDQMSCRLICHFSVTHPVSGRKARRPGFCFPSVIS